MSSKAQSWSIDITLGVIVFIAAFFLFYSLLNSSPTAKSKALQEDASFVIKQIASDDSILRIVDGKEVNITKLNELENLSYEELKARLRIEGDFCIYLEDEKGNLVLINNSYKGIGSPTINLSGSPCSQN